MELGERKTRNSPPELIVPSFWFTYSDPRGGHDTRYRPRKACVPGIYMNTCVICGAAIYSIGYPPQPRVICKTKPGTIPGTSCLSLRKLQVRGRKPWPYGLTKIFSKIQGGEFLADDGEVLPTIRDSY